MKELIKINNESKFAVSARELHEFLESKQEFANWIKGKIKDFEFINDMDFMIILSKSSGGRPSKEYFITLDMAKELSMLERNERGKQARRYFIACEKKLKEVSKPSSQIDLIIQSAIALKEQEQRITTVENKLENFEREREEAEKALEYVPEAGSEPEQTTLRLELNRLVRAYAETTRTFKTAWNTLYREVLYRLHIDVKRRAKAAGKKPLDIVEELNLMEKVYDIAYKLFGPQKHLERSFN